MEDRFGKVNRVWVMDRGMVSAENIAWLNATGRRYVIGTARTELGRFAKQIAEKTDWRQIREDIEVKICRTRRERNFSFVSFGQSQRKREGDARTVLRANRTRVTVAGKTHREEPKRFAPGRIGTPDWAALGTKLSRCGALLDLADRR
jgi:hypothetical protein